MVIELIHVYPVGRYGKFYNILVSGNNNNSNNN